MSAPHYQIIRRPIITEKGLGVKETQHTVVFEVSANATKTQIKEAARQITSAKCAAADRVKATGATGRKRT
jgi:large subunit ribosomal protein L23